MSDCDVHEITLYLKSIEREAGRTSEEKKQEIVRLDIDLLSCDNRVYKPEDLKRDYIVRGLEDRKSTRLNSSHITISNAVF